jgi:hypothetical protein
MHQLQDWVLQARLFCVTKTSILRLASQSWLVAAMQGNPCAHKHCQGRFKFEYHNRSNPYTSTGDGMQFQELDVEALRDAVAAVREKLDAHLINGDWAAKELFDYGIYVLDEELSRGMGCGLAYISRDSPIFRTEHVSACSSRWDCITPRRGVKTH